MKTKEGIRIAVATLCRFFPLSLEPGLRVFGSPNDKSPVFVTANFDLTVKRLSKHIRDMDCYLLIAPTGGINVWCAAKGGNFNAHSIISVVRTSRIGEITTNRTLILPQLSAPGVDARLVKKETGWRCKFGPVYANDIPEYAANGFKKTEAMCRVKWPLRDRLDSGIGVFFFMFLLILVTLAVFSRAWIVEFVVTSWVLFLLMYGLYPLIPGRVGWHKLLFLQSTIVAGLLGYIFLATERSWYFLDLFFMAIGLVFVIGIDFSGVTPLYKSDLDPLLDKIGIGQIGPINFGERSKIRRGRVVLDEASCTSCGICWDICPRGVYAKVRNERTKVIMEYPARCERCEACVLQCPRGAITIETLPPM